MEAKRHEHTQLPKSSQSTNNRRQTPFDVHPPAKRTHELGECAEQISPNKRGHKRSRECVRSSDMLYHDRVSPVLRGEELKQFKTWIDRSVDELPAVVGAGSVVKWPDSELEMFHATLTLPIDPKVITAVSGIKSRQRSRSWDVKSPQPCKAFRQSEIESMMRSREEEQPVRLPELKSHPTMLNLLAECKARKSKGPPTVPESTTTSDNQQSARMKALSVDLAIPDELFFGPNSYHGLEKVDLSDWTELCLESSSIFKQISERLSPRCVELNLNGLRYLSRIKDFQLLLQNCSRLKRLKLAEFESISKEGFHVIDRCCPRIEELCLADSAFVTDGLISLFASTYLCLNSLDINGCYRVTDAGLLLLSKKLTPMKCLRIDNCRYLSDTALIAFIATHGTHMRVLSMRSCPKVTDKTIRMLFMSQPTCLEELHVSDTQITDAALKFLSTIPTYYGNRVATAYHRCVKMDISGCNALTNISCSWIAASCPFLRSIKVARCSWLRDKGLHALSSLVYLHELDVSSCSEVTDLAMESFLLTDGSRKTQMSGQSTPRLKPIDTLCIDGCVKLGERTILAITQSCFNSISWLNMNRIAPVSSSTMIKLVKTCRKLITLLVRCQNGVQRSVLMNLASGNKCLEVLDIRECANVDDLALYPLIVMKTLKELHLSGPGIITNRGIRSLPTNLERLIIQRQPAACIDDTMCQQISERLRHLEQLDVSYCDGITHLGLKRILDGCPFLHQLNAFACARILPPLLMNLLNSTNKYTMRVIADPEMRFTGFAAEVPELASKTRSRERAIEAATKQHKAATFIQTQFRMRSKRYRKSQGITNVRWIEYCSATDIQRIYRGFRERNKYTRWKEQLANVVVFLQYQWRKRSAHRRVRRALGHWTNHSVVKMFYLWKIAYNEAKTEKEYSRASHQAAKAINFWGDRNLGRVVKAWHEYVQKKQFKGKKAIAFWKCQSAPRILEAWRVYTKKQHERQLRLTHVFLNVAELEAHNSFDQLEKTNRANVSAKKLIWRLWREFVVNQKLFVMKAMLSIVCEGLTHWAFRQWHQGATQKKQLREKNRKLLTKIIHRDKMAVWNAWLSFMDDQRAKKRAFARFSSNTQAKCWMRWKQQHQEILQLKAVSGRVVARFKVASAVRAVAIWYEFAQEQIELRQKRRRALAYFTNASLLRTFEAWAVHTEHVKAFRYRMEARMKNANLAFTFTSWVKFTRYAKFLHAVAAKIQAFWRGELTRRRVEDDYFYIVWATVLIQTAWRGRLGRAIMRAVTRKARLREYLRAERENDHMEIEESLMRKYDREIDMIVLLQRQWRGVAARHLFQEVRRARFMLKKQREAELQQIIRVEAQKRQHERERKEKQRQLAAIEIQRHIRGYLARCWYETKKEFLRQQRCAVRVQAVYRGRMSRRRTSALRRSYITRMEVLARRAIEGELLRTMGAKTRPAQRGLRKFLDFFGLDPATFLTDIRSVFKEVKEDFQTLKNFFNVIKAKVHANAALEAAAQAESDTGGPSSRHSAAVQMKTPLGLLKKTDTAKRFLRDFEQILDSTTAEKEKDDVTIRPGQSVRIVLRGHARCGETAFVLSVLEDIAQVKMDVDGELEFFPLTIAATKAELAKLVLHKVPELAFSAAYSNTVNGKISDKWRDELAAYAASIENESKRYCAARVIQCAARVYLARMVYQRELEVQGINAARRQEALLRVLKAFGCANTRIASILVQLQIVRPLNIPRGLSDEPLEIQKAINRFQRFLARRKEIQHAFLRLVPKVYKGDGSFHGGLLPVPYTRVIDKLVHYPLQWIQRISYVPVAQRLEKQGLAQLALFLGGAEFVKSFEEQHTNAAEHFFPQLENCTFCASEGWALVHGVFQKRMIDVDLALGHESKKHKLKRKKVPHGWGVAHFLTGRVDGLNKRNWLKQNSIEAQFKSLTIVKALKQEEREGRLETQILARQGTWNTLRSMEGARGYAKRHAELSLLEEQNKVFFKRFEDEIALRTREEEKIFAEELQMNELIEREKQELEKQGRHLHVLQQQVPESVTDVFMAKSSKSALEFINVGCHIEVEYDDEVWYDCEVIMMDPYNTCMADILYLEDQRRETIKLVESSSEDDKSFITAALERPRTVAEITAVAAAKAAADEIPFRKWRAGKAVDIEWEPPFDNGAAIKQYVVEWKDEDDEQITGTSLVASAMTDNGGVPIAPTKTTLWPIQANVEVSIRVRVAAENAKGVGLASVYMPLPEELTDVNYMTAVRLVRPPIDTSPMEKRERSQMEIEDTFSRVLHRLLTCTICSETFPSEPQVHEHISRTHWVPLICPFRSCKQVCASEKALRYHIWRCSVSKPTQEELQSELFMEIFNISHQYCMRKPRRHVLPGQSSTFAEHGGEEAYLEKKYQEARSVWFLKGQEIHEKGLAKQATMRRREQANRYDPPTELIGVDFASPELNVARRNAVIRSIEALQADLDAYILETNTQMDQFRHEESELQDYIALKTQRIKVSEEEWQKQSLKREKKKAAKSLDLVQEKISHLIAVSTQRIDEMKTEIARLTAIEKAFVPFTHQVVKMMRLGTTIHDSNVKSNHILYTHQVILDHFLEDLRRLMVRANTEVEGLEAWDAMIEARRKQLEDLNDELYRMRLLNLAEIEGYRQKRSEGDEAFELNALRSKQAKVVNRRKRAEEELMKAGKQTRAQVASAAAAAEATDVTYDIDTDLDSLKIANHDLRMHEQFLSGKAADAAYLVNDPPRAGATHASPLSQTPASVTQPGESTSEMPSIATDQTAEQATETAIASPRKRKPKSERKKLHELPHTYVRLECDFQDGFIRGNVCIEYNDGSVYEGPWVEDVGYSKPVTMEPTKTRHTANHWGRFTYRDGTVWEGEDVDNYFSPFTATGPHFEVISRDKRHHYKGAVRQGKYHGFGLLAMHFTYSQGEYVGEWYEGKRHGYGIERFNQGEIYEGYWEMDLYHGHGEMIYEDSSRYEGFYCRGKWHGEGVRTLEAGDQIIGVFHDGLLNGSGIMKFADKRHYHGEFRNTRRHGLGVLTFVNGDRYEGPFEHDLPHGEGKYITKSDTGGEPLVRLGRWENGERTAWLSKPSSQLATSTFIQYFAVQQKVGGETEINLMLPKFKTPYAVMIARLLPNLPEGVDNSDPFVRAIVQMLAKTQNVMIGANILDETIEKHTLAQRTLDHENARLEGVRIAVDQCERDCRARTRTVNALRQDLEAMTSKELEMQVKVETFWKNDTQKLEYNYKRAVAALHAVDVMDWYKFRTSKLEAVYFSLLEAFGILLNFTSNYYLQGSPYKPTKEELMMLLSNSDENVILGDKEGLIHRYNVKALYVLPLFDVYSFVDGARLAMLKSITHVIHHPRLRPTNVRLYQISPAATAVCVWVRAAYQYATKANEIAPVVRRVIEQLVIVERYRKSVHDEQAALEALQNQVQAKQLELTAQNAVVDAAQKEVSRLKQVIDDIEALDQAEQAPMVKEHIKRPQTFRPDSAGVTARSPDTATGAAAGEPQRDVNHRQVFEQVYDEQEAEKQAKRQAKEQVLALVLTDAEIASEFQVLKKEIRKVLDRNGGIVTLTDFPLEFEKIMLKPLEPMRFGVKKMRTLLELMDDICMIVEPQKQGDQETVQIPPDPEDPGMMKRLRCLCRHCPGVSYNTSAELSVHEKTRWHYANLQARAEGREPKKWTISSTFWTEVYDSTDGSICYYNQMTQEVVKSDEPPLEMLADEVMMELLDDAVEGQQDGETEDAWEEVADEQGNVYFYNHVTDETSWSHPVAATESVEDLSAFESVDECLIPQFVDEEK